MDIQSCEAALKFISKQHNQLLYFFFQQRITFALNLSSTTQTMQLLTSFKHFLTQSKFLHQIFVEKTSFIQIEDFKMERKSCQSINSYKFSQIFGYKGARQRPADEDLITCLKFDKQGKFIAIGDKAGRIVIFQDSKDPRKKSIPFEYCTEFQSHASQFDFLRSTVICESVVDINWLSKQGKYSKMITTNTHSIKFWKLFQKMEKKVVKPSGKQLTIPKLQNSDWSYVSRQQKIFPHRHSNCIKQTSLSNNEQYLLSTDESQMLLWDVEYSDQPYVVCDLNESSKLEQEVINCCSMHPGHDSIFVYGMSKGSLKLGDLRASSTVGTNSVCYKNSGTRQRNILLQLISNITSAKFSSNGKYLISRDYLTVKIWDINQTKRPLSVVQIHESLRSKLGEMVENQSIYDQFKVSISSDCNTILTGNYNNSFHLIDTQTEANSQYELNYNNTTVNRPIDKTCPPLLKMDYEKKVLASDFSPSQNLLAVASLNCLFTYSL